MRTLLLFLLLVGPAAAERIVDRELGWLLHVPTGLALERRRGAIRMDGQPRRVAGRDARETREGGRVRLLLPDGVLLAAPAGADYERLVRDLVPLDLWDPAFEALRARLPGAESAEALALLDLARRAPEALILPALAGASPRALADGLIHWRPRVRRLCYLTLLRHDRSLVLRGLADPDRGVRRALARQAPLELLERAPQAGAREMLALQPPARRYELLLRLVALPAPEEVRAARIDELARLPGPAARKALRILARDTGPAGAAALRALLEQGDPAALETAWQRLSRPLAPDAPLAPQQAARALALHLGPADAPRLDALLSAWERLREPRIAQLVALLAPLHDHLQRLSVPPDPAAERSRLARLVLSGRAAPWVLERHARLVDPLGPGRPGVELLRIDLPRPGALLAKLPGHGLLEGSGIDLQAPLQLRVWRPDPHRPFELPRFPFPFVVSCGTDGDPRPFLARWLDGRLAVRIDGRRCLIGSSSAAIDDHLASPAGPPAAQPSLVLPLHRWIEQADLPSLLVALGEEFVDERTRLVVRLDPSGLAGQAALDGLPRRIARIFSGKPAALLRAPRELLPRDTAGLVLVDLQPQALAELVREWPLKWYQKPVGLLAGGKKEELVETLRALRSEAGVALLGDRPVAFIEVDPARAAALLALARKGRGRARLIGRFLAVAQDDATLDRLGRAPLLHESWKPAAREPAAGHGFLQLSGGGILTGHLERNASRLLARVRLSGAPAPPGRRLPLAGQTPASPALAIEGRLLGPWPAGPQGVLNRGRLRLVAAPAGPTSHGLAVAQGALHAVAGSAVRIPLSQAQLEAVLQRSHGWRVDR